MHEFMDLSQREDDELQPWESEESRLAKDAWKGSTRRDAMRSREEFSADTSVRIPVQEFQRLAAAAAEQVGQQLLMKQLVAELHELRAQVKHLEDAAFAPQVMLGADASKFERELLELERSAGLEHTSLPDGYDLGFLIDEWT